MDFSLAFKRMKAGARLYRRSWNVVQRGILFYVFKGEITGLEEQILVYYDDEYKHTRIWLPMFVDLFADDWEIYKGFLGNIEKEKTIAEMI